MSVAVIWSFNRQSLETRPKPGGQLFALTLPHEDDVISQALGEADELCRRPTEDIQAGAPIRTSLLLLEKSESPTETRIITPATAGEPALPEAEAAPAGEPPSRFNLLARRPVPVLEAKGEDLNLLAGLPLFDLA